MIDKATTEIHPPLAPSNDGTYCAMKAIPGYLDITPRKISTSPIS